MLLVKIVLVISFSFDPSLGYAAAQLSSENPSTAPLSINQRPQTANSTTEKTQIQENKGSLESSASFNALLESFGGDAVDMENRKTETATVNTRTGIYFLLDWNTFLDLDDQLGRRVNLRFQPKIGDPKRFLSVSVP
ncbi:hypothetical protein Zmor_005631 [Zophobas morio]|uniref:Uncharacterized protein n=1 Tax=Zophobas morio TaxID=2755281 RepID=A0AA38ISE9_9CUCU|nr:hypothetical protein Zmor_005631 [Zophobas morio]